ncbi:hypothetical protein [Limnohabitans sp. 2KL-27]|uniref:hypothetical protein n=1 Tax=Limnohabitans sp. 2KL-27 TaxID=1100705 RepID=UPI000A4CC5F1|nr:hypothetical protein [Limnohabitans sp. 2KL-27]
MPKLKTFAAMLVCASLLPISAAYAQTISKAEYQTSKTRISTDYKADKAACSALAGNAKDICQEEAKGKEKMARAELEYNYTGKDADRINVLVAKAKAAYEVAKERCDDLAGNAKDVCRQEAKAVEKKALADAKMKKEIGDAKKGAATEKVDADYKVAIEKCDALAGDAKASCIATAKAKFGKN